MQDLQLPTKKVMKMKSRKDYEELKPVDDTGSENVGGGGNGNPQPHKPNKDWVKWVIFGFGLLILALIIAAAVK